MRNPASNRGTAESAGEDCPQALHALRAIANAKQQNAPRGQTAGTWKTTRPTPMNRHRIPKRRINAEPVQLLDFCRFPTYLK